MTELAKATGLDVLRAIRDGEAPPASIQRTLDFDLVEVEEGRVAFVGRPGEAHLNPMGGVHGGWAMTLLDSATGAAVHTTLSAGEAYGTVEIKVNLVRPISPATGPLRAEGAVVHRGSRLATAEGRLVGERDGRLYAHGSATCMILSG